ncbi:uncharacterized protein GGS22DRAFT_171680 [Annulohypoxylon maeteangense]|uniref:uncharacterized protein n=1 Tax=Annulohypoxylon maeteangense TaxID=1927788 RepID=UPI0020082CFD|nr:uncharacterized protein GGS22DRAFT_171680 [Annulohypoxylon maeteangense]KAI0881718.1 hypothetical protein GGS22DRAFT_171680 [Annulohypoxylon maeteangense]
MSLGIKSLWRARILKVHIGGFSPIPREQYNPSLFQRSSPRRWYSTPTMTGNDTSESSTYRSISSLGNETRKKLIRARLGTKPMEPALTVRPFRHRNKRTLRHSVRQYRRSVARQVLYDVAHKASGKPIRNWRATLAFMLLVTPNHGEVLHFRVIIGKDVSENARQVLSGPDTHISEICRKNESFVQIEEQDQISKDNRLIFNLSGSEIAVRNSLRDILGVVGAITAVRVSDPAFREFLLDVWKDAVEKRPETQLLRNGEAGETVADDRTITVKSSLSNPNSVYKPYELKTRADDIEVPKTWTQRSFEEYVAALVYGQVPNHLARALYPSFPDHQQTVVSILLELFHTRATRSAISLSATKMAIGFIESTGRGFRRASRLIYNSVRRQRMLVDAELYTTFLISASKAKDLNTFNRILRLMVRKGYPPQSRAWVAFLVMMKSPTIKRYIVEKLMEKNLDHNPMILRAIGREMATLDLEFTLHRPHVLLKPYTGESTTPSATVWIRAFLTNQNKKYGPGWLDTITLNKMLEILGRHGQLDACKTLLGLVYDYRNTFPDAATLNTMLSRANGFANQMEMLHTILSRWPNLVPDEITYHLLFRLAWKRHYPNMLRVVWRYAVLTHKTTSKMRYTLSRLLTETDDRSNRYKFLKEWEDVIIGKSELAEMRETYPNRFYTRHILPKYFKNAQWMRPSVELGVKLKEAISMDVEIHRLLKEGKIVDKESLSVDIPLEPNMKPPPSKLHAFRYGPDAHTLDSDEWHNRSQYPPRPRTKVWDGSRWISRGRKEESVH